MKVPRHTLKSLAITERLSHLGLTTSIQQRIGAFALSWGLFESTLERAVWALRKEDVRGVRPSTDRSQVSDWIVVLGNGSQDLSVEANDVLKVSAKAAEDLMHYRHALMHGTLVAIPGAPFFIRNPRWSGEIRKRESGDAQVDENLLDLAIEAAWVLFQLVGSAEKACRDAEHIAALESLRADATRAKSSANELRNLAVLMNHEKY